MTRAFTRLLFASLAASSIACSSAPDTTVGTAKLAQTSSGDLLRSHGTLRIAVIMVKSPGNPVEPFNRATVEGMVFGDLAPDFWDLTKGSLANFVTLVSYGNLAVDGTSFDWWSLPVDDGCSFLLLRDEVDAYAQANAIDLRAWDAADDGC